MIDNEYTIADTGLESAWLEDETAEEILSFAESSYDMDIDFADTADSSIDNL